jgi:hypothetical protein
MKLAASLARKAPTTSSTTAALIDAGTVSLALLN